MAQPVTDVSVHLIAATRPDLQAVWRWLAELGVREPDLPDANQIPEELFPIWLAGKRCYNSFAPYLNDNLHRVRHDMEAYLDHVLESGHGSVLEHVNFTFALEGVTRVLTHELVRHRVGVAYSQESLRYVRTADLKYLLPPSLLPLDGDVADEVTVLTLDLFQEAFEHDERTFQRLCDLHRIDEVTDFGRKKRLTSLFRRVLGQGMCTGIVATFNVRALRHVISQRVDPAAEEEICMVFSRVLEVMSRKFPQVFGDYHVDPHTGYPKAKYVKV